MKDALFFFSATELNLFFFFFFSILAACWLNFNFFLLPFFLSLFFIQHVHNDMVSFNNNIWISIETNKVQRKNVILQNWTCLLLKWIETILKSCVLIMIFFSCFSPLIVTFSYSENLIYDHIKIHQNVIKMVI